MQIVVRNVRLAFPVLFQPKAVNGQGAPAFSASLLISPDDPQIKTIEAAIQKVAVEKWGTKAEAVLKQMRAQDKLCLHDGELKAAYAGFEGVLYISARNTVQPTVLDRDRSPLQERDGKPYAGCFVNASLDLWAQDNDFGKRINASLRGVQFFRDGDAFVGGGAASEDEFDDLSVEESADDLL